MSDSPIEHALSRGAQTSVVSAWYADDLARAVMDGPLVDRQRGIAVIRLDLDLAGDLRERSPATSARTKSSWETRTAWSAPLGSSAGSPPIPVRGQLGLRRFTTGALR